MLDLRLNDTNPKLLSPLTLAFIGDAVYELLVRERLASANSLPANTMHKRAVTKVCASAQSKAFDALCEILTEDELSVLKRGRNANSTKVPKNSTPCDYRKATGVESLFGYLYLKGELERVNALYLFIEEKAAAAE